MLDEAQRTLLLCVKGYHRKPFSESVALLCAYWIHELLKE